MANYTKGEVILTSRFIVTFVTKQLFQFRDFTMYLNLKLRLVSHHSTPIKFNSAKWETRWFIVFFLPRELKVRRIRTKISPALQLGEIGSD